MTTELNSTPRNLTELTSAVFGTPNRLNNGSELHQHFVAVLGFIYNWKADASKLNEQQRRQFEATLQGRDSNTRTGKSHHLISALMHFSFAKKGYEKLVDIVVEHDTDAAHETLEALQEIFAYDIQTMNKTSYEFTMSLVTSRPNRRPTGSSAPSRRPVGHG